MQYNHSTRLWQLALALVFLSCSSGPRKTTLRDVVKPGAVVPTNKSLALLTIISDKMPADDFAIITHTFQARFREKHPQTIENGRFRNLLAPRKFRSLELGLLDDRLTEKKAGALLAATGIRDVDYVLILKVERLNIREYREKPVNDKKEAELAYCSDHILELKFYLYDNEAQAISGSGNAANHREICGVDPKQINHYSVEDVKQGKYPPGGPVATEWDGKYPTAAPLAPIVEEMAVDIRSLIFP